MKIFFNNIKSLFVRNDCANNVDTISNINGVTLLKCYKSQFVFPLFTLVLLGSGYVFFYNVDMETIYSFSSWNGFGNYIRSFICEIQNGNMIYIVYGLIVLSSFFYSIFNCLFSHVFYKIFVTDNESIKEVLKHFNYVRLNENILTVKSKQRFFRKHIVNIEDEFDTE